MSPVALLLVLLALAALIALAHKGVFTKGRSVGSHHWPVFPKQVLSPVEQQLYQRLIRAFPEHVVLSQVAFSQLFGVRKGENFTAICEAAGISLHRLNVKPLPSESELRALLQLPPLPQRAPVLHLRDGAPR